jgi:hypothetical protein
VQLHRAHQYITQVKGHEGKFAFFVDKAERRGSKRKLDDKTSLVPKWAYMGIKHPPLCWVVGAVWLPLQSRCQQTHFFGRSQYGNDWRPVKISGWYETRQWSQRTARLLANKPLAGSGLHRFSKRLLKKHKNSEGSSAN